MAARATWKGVLSVSLVSIQIKVYPATESSEGLAFHQLHTTCQSRMTQKKWCTTCACEVPSADVVKGFEFEKGKYVLLLPEELDAVQPPSTRVIDLTQFAEASALPFMAIDRAYYLAPDGPDDGPASQAYALMVEAMDGKVGIGKLALYGREYLVAVGPQGHSLLLYTLHHTAELRPSPYAAALDALYTFTARSPEYLLAQRIVAALTGPLNLSDFTDAYKADLRRLIDAKIAGQEIVEPAVSESVPVVNLREALEQSLAAVSATKKTPAKALPTPKRKRA